MLLVLWIISSLQADVVPDCPFKWCDTWKGFFYAVFRSAVIRSNSSLYCKQDLNTTK